MSILGSKKRPLRVAVVGSGPAGFYAAGALLQSSLHIRIDLFDRLPVPFGLVRSGVAPDHQKIKNVTRQYDKIGRDERVRFLGNVFIGKDLSIEELRRFYDAVILAHGSEADRRLGIPGEDLPGSRTATEFVGWYNCHPDFRQSEFDLSGKHVVIIGQGNVAMDVSRILAKPASALSTTDIAGYALEKLCSSAVETITIIGRRGPLQAAFTEKELKELGEIDDCRILVDPEELRVSDEEQQWLERADKGVRRNYEILREFSERPAHPARRSLSIRFFRSPVEVIGKGRVQSIRLEVNRLENGSAIGTGQFETLRCDLLFRSIGYRGVGISGLPFDPQRAIYPNEKGRVEQGIYAAGWIKRGPSGVIGTNKPDSVETVETLLSDVPGLEPCSTPDTEALVELLQSRGVVPLSYADWLVVDGLEVQRGASNGKPREKFVSIEEMQEALRLSASQCS